MSGTRLPSLRAPATEKATPPPFSESLWRLGALLWPFATGAVAINLFLAGLIVHSAGWAAAISPAAALLWSLPLGLPATWAAALWVRHLIRQAEGRG